MTPSGSAPRSRSRRRWSPAATSDSRPSWPRSPRPTTPRRSSAGSARSSLWWTAPEGSRARAILGVPMFKFLSRLGDSNEREVRALGPIVERVNALEPEIQALTDDELRARTDALRARLRDRVGDLLTPIELRETDPDADASESALAGADADRLAHELQQ